MLYQSDDMVARLFAFDEYVNVYSEPLYHANRSYERATYVDRRGDIDLGGIRSHHDATALLRDGWAAGAERLAEIRSEIAPPEAKSRKRRPRWADDGDELDVDRALRGQWDQAWRTSHRVWSNGVTCVDVVALCGGPWWLTREQLFWAGASAVIVCDVLESAGYVVRLLGASCVESRVDPHWGATLITLKETTEPVRTDIIASVMCHAGVHRTQTFRARLTLPFDAGDGLGMTRGWNHSGTFDRLQGCGALPHDAILLNQTYDRDACLAEIRRVIALVEH
jgi:hypothetical protein